MLTLKFGGTSLGSASRMKEVAKLIRRDSSPKIVVLSAVSGTTNSLVAICEYYKQQHKAAVRKVVKGLLAHYQEYVAALFEGLPRQAEAWQFVEEKLQYIGGFEELAFSVDDEKAILAQGEIISTNLMHRYLNAIEVDNVLLPAFKFMRTKEGHPNMAQIEELLQQQLASADAPLYITQGYICLNESNKIDNLRRGGSDYTASIIGAVTEAKEVQIWTDIDGMHNNDPRVVNFTKAVPELSFDEAAELAYFGAKILHPSTILPAQKNNINVRLKNTMAPDATGTLISGAVSEQGIKAIAAKEGITAIKIKSHRMLLAYGFLKNLFEVFERYQTPIDMVATSEVAVSLTIDDATQLAKIQEELKQYGTVEVDENQAIICIVGQFVQEQHGVVAQIFSALSNISIRMISFGGSRNNISILVAEKDKNTALQALNKGLFETVGK